MRRLFKSNVVQVNYIMWSDSNTSHSINPSALNALRDEIKSIHTSVITGESLEQSLNEIATICGLRPHVREIFLRENL